MPEALRALTLDGVVVTAGWQGDTAYVAAGDGTVTLLRNGGGATAIVAHAGAILATAAHPDGRSIVTGGDDGRLLRITGAGEVEGLARFAGRWVHDVVTDRGVIVAAVGREAHVLLSGQQGVAHRLKAPGTIGAMAFDPKGRRLALPHYGGVTLSWALAPAAAPTLLPWSGSHLAATWSPDGRHVVSTMQENALHGWRLADGEHMRMQGYAAKVRSMSWSAKGRWLLTGGAECVIGWPFAGKAGPMGRTPLELGPATELVTRVAAHPREDTVAAGYADGSLRLMRLPDGASTVVRKGGGAAVTALAWRADGKALVWGADDGACGIVSI